MNTNRDRISVAMLIIAGAVASLLLLSGIGIIPAGADDPTPEDRCQGSEAKFYAYQARSNGQFGPAVTTNDVDEAVAELYSRMDCDPLLAVVIAADASGQWGDANALYSMAQRMLRDRQAWDALVARTRAILDQCNPVFRERSNEYMTLAMRRGANPQVMPTLYQVSPDRPTFRTLEFDCGGGRVVVLKLDCGFQPVHQFFSLITMTPANPGSTPSINPPGTPPHNPPPPTSAPPPTTPPPTTPPPTVPPGCPTGPNGCKPPIPPTPATCNLPDDLCHGGTGPPTPRPPDPVQPTPTVAPPPSTFPPPVYTVPPDDPDPTVPVTSPPTAPD